MNITENEMIERYLYHVVRYLPQKQQEDIKKELSTLIEDMMLERIGGEDREMKEEDIVAVLKELGKPSALASQYRGGAEHLIGGEYYTIYCYILKIVLLITGFGMLVSNLVSGFIHVADMNMTTEEITKIITKDFIAIGTIPAVLLEAFAVLTIIFIIFERYQVKLNMKPEEWKPEQLSPVPYKKNVCKRSDSVAGIIFSLIFIILFATAPHVIGLWGADGSDIIAIPIFNLDIWNQVLPLFLIGCSLDILYHVARLIIGRYNVTVAIFSVINSTVSLILIVIAFTGYQIWNPDFIMELEQFTGFGRINSEADLLFYWDTPLFTQIFLSIIIFAYILETATCIYRVIRYGKKELKVL